MTATDLDVTDAQLDALMARWQARAARAAPPLVNAAGDEITALAASGLVTVQPGDLITSQWGNLTYSQTALTFASVADRNAQWPTRPEGARCVTLDTNSPWIYRNGAWHGAAAGILGSVAGPTTAVNCGGGATTLLSLTVPVVAGRQYRVNAYARGQQTTANGLIIAVITGVNLQFLRFVEFICTSSNVGIGGGGVALYTATATGTHTFTVTGQTNAGTWNVAANQCEMFVEDIGS